MYLVARRIVARLPEHCVAALKAEMRIFPCRSSSPCERCCTDLLRFLSGIYSLSAVRTGAIQGVISTANVRAPFCVPSSDVARLVTAVGGTRHLQFTLAGK